MRRSFALVAVALTLLVLGCGESPPTGRAAPAETTVAPPSEPAPAASTPAPPEPPPPTRATRAPAPATAGGADTAPPATAGPAVGAHEVVVVAYRVERRTNDDATAGFEETVEATLSDPRGWVRAGFDLVRRAEDAPYLIVLAEGEEVDRLCLPYDTYGKYSCQNGPVVALNADRWRTATPKWTADLPTFRQMLVNHEVGHLLGQKHPRPQCPRRGQPAPVMNQQSTELDGCLPNPWPLDWEVALAARHDRPLAPGPDRR
ncbi:MAG: DUF3152 domain-containing protein [Actinobacteria bacterium]|nr:DUF3152 domain-containing protein [Actinomycetota bacterium]MBW3649820.1 DUF3152 domain-containing protein [Actinomycetota bacterium]